MREWLSQLPEPALHLWSFIGRVLRRFFKDNKGFLLAGAVGYNALLSLVPMFAILLVLLSRIFDEAQVLSAVQTELSLILPGQADQILESLKSFMDGRGVFGAIGFIVMLFFSSIAFRMMEDALAVIFKHHKTEERSFLVSAFLPYLYVGLMGIGLFALTMVTGVLDAFSERTVTILKWSWSVSSFTNTIIQSLSFLGLVLMLTSFYMVMPQSKVQFRRALIGGLCAAFLWEIVRNVLVWYFDNLSLVNVVYGSLAAVIIVLLSMEIAAIIILIGAQIIAELEWAAEHDLPWYADAAEVALGEGASL